MTEGFVEEFGKARVRNTPIIESGALGAAMGLALEGFRPMVEMQFGDFITCGFNQIVNNLAKTHYRWGAALPVVIRVPVGGGTGAGPFHSQNPEAWFTHVAGLERRRAGDAGRRQGPAALGASTTATRCSISSTSPSTDPPRDRWQTATEPVPIGPARLAREGRDLTIVTWGVGVVLGARRRRDARGRRRLDRGRRPAHAAALGSRDGARLGRRRPRGRVVLHEAPVTGGFGGEIAAAIGQDAFAWLDAPVTRVGGLDMPVPFSKKLEAIYSPQGRLLPAVRQVLAY